MISNNKQSWMPSITILTGAMNVETQYAAAVTTFDIINTQY